MSVCRFLVEKLTVSHHENIACAQSCVFLPFQFFLCEVLNFLVDVMNLYFTDVFLGGRFLRYGTQVIKYYAHSHAERRDLPNPMCTVFPTVTR